MTVDDSPSGPDPSTLETVDSVPRGVVPINLRVTYSSNSLNDYVSIKRSGRTCTLELASPLFGVVRTAGEVKNLAAELKAALGAIGLDGIFSHFSSAVSEYFNSLMSVPALPDEITLATIIYVLEKLYSKNLIRLGYIHQASLEELPQWLGLADQARWHSDLTVRKS